MARPQASRAPRHANAFRVASLPPTAAALLLLAAGLLAVGCGGDHCQSGAKYGTQCYSTPEREGVPPEYAGGSDTDESNKPASPEPGRTLPATAPR